MWPQYAKETWQKLPECLGFATVDSITLLKPAINEEQCTDLTTHPWISTLGQPRELIVRLGLGLGGSNVISTVNQEGHWMGLGQDIDSRCLDLMK